MKKYLLKIAKTAVFAFLVFQANSSFGQVVFTSVPDSIAVLNELYTYDVEASYAPNAPVYSLVTAPTGMVINSSSGLIQWTPASLNMGGQVIIMAQNNAGSFYQSYWLFITNAVVCDENIISYWPLDAKSGTSVLDVVGGYDGLWEGAPGPEPVISTDAMIGNAVQFDPVVYEDWGYNIMDENQYEFKGTMQFSISLWFKNQPSSIPSFAHEETMVGRWCGNAANNAGWEVKWDPANARVEFHMRDIGPTDTTLTSAVEVNDYEWHHVVASFYPDPANDSYMHLWVDNQHSWCKYDFWLDDFSGSEKAYLGYYYWGLNPYSGYLDDVAIWSKELLQSDVTTLYNKGLAHQPLCSEGAVAPIITSTPVTSASEDVSYTYTLTHRSMGGAAVTKSAPVLPSWLSFNAGTGVLSGTPTSAQTGPHNVTLRVSQDGINVDQPFTITVSAVNDPPVFTSTPVTSALSRQVYEYWITTSDEEGQNVSITCPTKPSWLTFSSSTGSGLLQGTPSRAQAGTHDVTLNASDGTNTTVQSFSIEVVIDNHDPVITSTAYTSGTVDVLYSYTITATDEDDDDLTFSAPTLPSWLNFNTGTHVLSGIPAQADLGTHNVTLAVNDGTDEVQETFTINVVANSVENVTGSLAKVYPVPASEYIVLEFAERLDRADLQILNLSGELVKKVDVSNLTKYFLDISDLKPANYLFRVISDKGQQTGTIVKQ